MPFKQSVSQLVLLIFLFSIFSVWAEEVSGISEAQSLTPYKIDSNTYSIYKKEAARIASSLDDNALAAQVLMTGIDGKTSLVSAMRILLERIPVGGVMLFRGNIDTPKDDVKKLLSQTVELASFKTGIAPFVAVDHEGGLVHRFGPGVEKLPSAASFEELMKKNGTTAALESAVEIYERSAKEIRELGITMVLAPVVEILDDNNRLFLETRSYGSDPDFIRAASSAYMTSMGNSGIASVLKHFPGNSAADPHSGVSVLDAGKSRLNEMVKSFAEIIRSLSPPVVMISHVLVPAIDNSKPSSLSSLVINDWLRGELGFEGIALADDYSMTAISSTGLDQAAAAVEALNSGIDMIMTWPRNLNSIHAAILNALKGGYLSRDRLEEAACRIVTEKIRFGIITYKGGL